MYYSGGIFGAQNIKPLLLKASSGEKSPLYSPFAKVGKDFGAEGKRSKGRAEKNFAACRFTGDKEVNYSLT
jgi:hypothetical protein